MTPFQTLVPQNIARRAHAVAGLSMVLGVTAPPLIWLYGLPKIVLIDMWRNRVQQFNHTYAPNFRKTEQ